MITVCFFRCLFLSENRCMFFGAYFLITSVLWVERLVMTLKSVDNQRKMRLDKNISNFQFYSHIHYALLVGASILTKNA